MSRLSSTPSHPTAMTAPAFDGALLAALLQACEDASENDLAQRWLLLEAAHVVGQTRWRPHIRVHRRMLALAWRTGQWSEVIGQCFRLALVPLGHLLGRLPVGNPGSARVGAFRSVSVSPEMAAVLSATRAGLLRPSPGEGEPV